MSDFQTNLTENATKLFSPLSFYSPLIICVSMIYFSVFTGTLDKALAFFMFLFLCTSIRTGFIYMMGKPNDFVLKNPICLTGLTEIIIPKDITYSTFIILYTMVYLIVPLKFISKQTKLNMLNYKIIFFFSFYFALDLFVKSSFDCIVDTTLIIRDVAFALFLGMGVTSLMYGTRLKSYLYINEVNSNGEVCSVPTKQQFKCNVYKNGELVGNL